MDRSVVFEALDDETAAAILTATSDRARSASELTEVADASRSTVYRRLDWLVENGLVHEGYQLDREGNHHNVYRAAIERVEVELAHGEIECTVERREDAVDRFVRIWEDIRGES